MNRVNNPAALLLPLALALSACGDDAAPAETAADGSGAVGEVEGGTINDNMLPLESVTSKAPSRGGSDENDGDGEESEEGDDAETAPGS